MRFILKQALPQTTENKKHKNSSHREKAKAILSVEEFLCFMKQYILKRRNIFPKLPHNFPASPFPPRAPPPFPEIARKGGDNVEKEFYIIIDGEKVQVTEEVYRAFKRPAWAERKRRMIRADMERSLDLFLESGFDIPSDAALVDEIVEDRWMIDSLSNALHELTTDERSLIDALFYQEKSEREIANEIGISSVAVHKRKHKILEKLHEMMKK